MSDEQESWLTMPDDFAPGTMGCHEALHVAALIENLIDNELYRHPAIQRDPDWLLETERALLAIRRLYQLIGAKHLA